MEVRNLASKSDIIQTLKPHIQQLNDKGRWIMGCCPYHDDKNPSFGIDTKNGGFNCFACGVTGTYKQLLEHLGITQETGELDAMTEGEWNDVLSSLDRKASKKVTWPGEDVRIASLITDVYVENTPEKYIKYLDKRGVKLHWAIHWGIGWSPKEENKVLIPVNNLNGNQVNWIERRRIDNKRPKYWRPKGVRKELALFGFSNIRNTGNDWIVVTEGVFDTIALQGRSIPAVCCFGGLSRFQRNVLAKKFSTIYIAFDGDDAGRRKAKEAKAMLKDCGVTVVNINLPEGKDPGNYSFAIARRLKLIA